MVWPRVSGDSRVRQARWPAGWTAVAAAMGSLIAGGSSGSARPLGCEGGGGGERDHEGRHQKVSRTYWGGVIEWSQDLR